MMLSYDTMVATDNPVRLIDLMCEKFISSNPLQEVWKGNNKLGRKSYPPSSMLGLLVYGYFNGISSSRKLENETYRNIELLWLMENLQPDHWTICEFRRDNEKLIKEFLKTFRKFLLDESYATGKKIVFDGSKVKAYARREMLNTEGIRKKLENIDKSILEYLSQMEDNDSNDDELEIARGEIKLLKEKIGELESQRVKLEAAGRALEACGKKQIAPNDKDAVLVKGRDGKFPGYNVQTGVDAKGHFIMHDEVTTEPNDLGQLENCVVKTQDETGVAIEEVLADKGYGNTTQILNIESESTQCFVPMEKTSRDKEEEKGFVFIYNHANDTYTCPQGKKLLLHRREKESHGSIYRVYKCFECHDCPVRQQCTKSKTGRVYSRNIEHEKIYKYKKKLTSKYARERINERKGIVEHPFGTIKWMMGKFNFLLTGKQKVQIEFDLYSTAYNLKRLINCASTKKLMGQVMSYNWEIA